MEPSIARLLFGTDEAVPASLNLRAGPLALTFRAGRLWHVRLNDTEIWHCVAFLYRDADWCTPEPVIDTIESEVGDDAFTLRYEGRIEASAVISFRAKIEGTSAGHIRFSAKAVPSEGIQANRLGICLLHPQSVCGANVEIEHIDGPHSRSTFPTLIPPWPPFMLIRSIRHEYAEARWARCEFFGDAFELEDQRNNADASFKTYSRSNLMPRPYWLRKGVAIEQSIELKLEAPWSVSSSRQPTPVKIAIGDVLADLPMIGIEISKRDLHPNEELRSALRSLNPAFLHLSLERNHSDIDWKAVADLLTIAGAKLRLDIDMGEPGEAGDMLAKAAESLREARVVLESIAVFPSEQAVIDSARESFPRTPIGGGTPHFFVQLNRIEHLGDVDFLTFTTSSIVHGADDESVMLTLQSLPAMFDTLRARYGPVPVRIGPSAISARASPLGSQPPADGTRRIALARRDPRCRGLFGAAWCLGYIAQCASAGAAAVTLLGLTGESGLVGQSESEHATRHPPFWVLERLRAPSRIHDVALSDPSRLAALALARDGQQELLLANLTGEPIDVELSGWPSDCVGRIIDAEAMAASSGGGWVMAHQVEALPRRLSAYALVWLKRPRISSRPA